MIAVTYLLVEGGFDWWYYGATRIPALLQVAIVAAPLGFFVPLFLPIILYLAGEERKDHRLQNAAAAILQASAIAVLLSATYKAFTGRLQPQLVAHPPFTANISEAFNFGFLQHGVFWGWPSSHTAVAFAMAITLALLYKQKKVLFYSAIIYAMYIGLAVSVTIHWFSDFVAGAILGTVVAFVVTKSFREN